MLHSVQAANSGYWKKEAWNNTVETWRPVPQPPPGTRGIGRTLKLDSREKEELEVRSFVHICVIHLNSVCGDICITMLHLCVSAVNLLLHTKWGRKFLVLEAKEIEDV